MTTIDNKNNDLKTQAKYINKLALEVGSDILKLAVKNGESSQEILAKMMKGGVTLFGMQQDFALTVLEKVAGEVKTNKYFKDSLQKYAEVKETVEENKIVKESLKRYNEAKETVEARVEEVKGNLEARVEAVIDSKIVKDSLDKYNKAKETVETKAEEVKGSIELRVEEVKEKVSERVEFVKEKAVETFNKVKENLNVVGEIPTNLEEATEKVEEVVEAVEDTVEEVVETVTEVVADNITKIKGLGAKSGEVLNAAGYDSFEKLANATEEELREVLAAAGSSFKKFNPAPWIEAAKEMLK